MYAKHLNNPFKIKDLGDRGLRRCETFLKRLGVAKNTFESDWEDLKKLSEVRNKIAHAGSIYDEGTYKIANEYTKIFTTPKSRESRIQIKKEGILVVKEHMMNALGSIIKGIRKT